MVGLCLPTAAAAARPALLLWPLFKPTFFVFAAAAVRSPVVATRCCRGQREEAQEEERCSPHAACLHLARLGRLETLHAHNQGVMIARRLAGEVHPCRQRGP